MFRIRRIYDCALPVDQQAVGQVQEILRQQFPLIAEQEVAKLPDQLQDPLKHRFRSVLFVAENARGRVRGFALVLYFAELSFCYLDFLSAAPGATGGGVGGALFQRLREGARQLGAKGVFFECLPDDPALCRDPALLRQNAARLRFYEAFGARPVIGTAYETPLWPGDDCPPLLVLDGLDLGQPLRRSRAREIVRAILECKYVGVCPPEYVERVVSSFTDDPVRLRAPKYGRARQPVEPTGHGVPSDQRISLTVNEGHALHHVRERGYVEAPVRVAVIRRAIEKTGLFEPLAPRRFSEQVLATVHDRAFVRYLKTVCEKVGAGPSVYPYVFPIRNAARPPKELPVRAGYYCIDTFTPLNANAYRAARGAVNCALTATGEVLRGRRLAYALVRPPSHHAERRAFGGFCYFNATAIAAERLSHQGRVAVLDVDSHHGNGTERIFYGRADVFTVSLHGHPSFAYPYFSGFADERGEGEGEGFNLNVPLPETLDGAAYRDALAEALRRIRRFDPSFLVVALGLDTARGDPTGTWGLTSGDFHANGKLIGSLRLPTLVCQEGGYRIRTLGTNAASFFSGLWEGTFGALGRRAALPRGGEP
ncbi:MAG: histone deacetylase family protein [Deltaproteobacteria bacterium]|nr:histone deacetylase family protein [Deltaproteobacteria bacterium]